MSLNAWAAAANDDLSFERRRWTLADGAPGQAFDLTQTSDGVMWFSSSTGLYSFDGGKFKPETKVYGHGLQSSATSSLRYIPGGGLAVGYTFGGLSLFTAQGARHFVAGKDFPLGSVNGITAAADGQLYACTTTAIVKLEQGKWVQVGRRKQLANQIRFDAEGTLWAIGGTEVFALPKGAEEFASVMKFPAQVRYSFVNKRLQVKLPDGSLARLDSNGALHPIQLDHPERYTIMLNGPHGTVVALHEGSVARLNQRADGSWHEVEFYPPIVASSAGAGNGGIGLITLLDREGNLWRTLYDGVERIRLHRFHQVRRQDHFWLAQPGLNEEMWVGSNTLPMLRIRPDGAPVETQVKVPNAILRTAPDHVWVGTNAALWEFGRDKEQRWELPVPANARLGVQALALEGDGRLLVSLARHGLWRFDNGAWQQDPRLQGQQDPTPISMLRDAHGKTWLGLTNNRVGVLTADALKLLPASSNLQIGNTLSMLDAGGRLLIGGDMGVAWVDGDKVQPMTFQRRAPVQRVTGMVVDHLGQLWLHCNDGLLRVPAAELAQFWHTPAQPLDSELFNFEDGVNGNASPTRPLPSLSLDSAGRVYYATIAQAGWIDPAQIRRNPRAPDVIIQSLQTADGELQPLDGMKLPGHPTAVDISFAATALSIPERVRLKYRLEGVDGGWKEVQHDRSAHYTNLAPGAYRFQVIAANEDGVWNTKGAELRFHIAPQFWQTWWFRLLCAALLLLAVVAAYQWRIATVRRRADERARALLEATLQERGRIARSLHDNLLQAVQALILRFHTLQSRMLQEPDLQAKLDTVLIHAQELVENARDEVVGLRCDPVRDELFTALRKSVAVSVPAAESLLHFTTTGAQRPLREDATREVFYVLREALWNSARHAQASRIAAELCYGEQVFSASVTDDGIGIGTVAASVGRWGIVGMRERVQRMGGQIEIGAGEQGGTVVRLTIPAQLAYA
ncbi:hypothetical protein KW842_11245 [Duganella sp. sic0402]|uniref:sensor histidine kinase n=1 Tax=Duganella sp. sic0402 TaxID=2854786 RepID=UPI001C457545|nr:hypothetical protein [Duganella sp. sic0402]